MPPATGELDSLTGIQIPYRQPLNRQPPAFHLRMIYDHLKPLFPNILNHSRK
jgi:adenylylsulfate kinase-like enzyme